MSKEDGTIDLRALGIEDDGVIVLTTERGFVTHVLQRRLAIALKHAGIAPANSPVQFTDEAYAAIEGLCDGNPRVGLYVADAAVTHARSLLPKGAPKLEISPQIITDLGLTPETAFEKSEAWGIERVSSVE